MATLAGVAPPGARTPDLRALTPELFLQTGKRRKVLPSSASPGASTHTLWQLDRAFRFYCSTSGRWEVGDEVAYDERLGTFQSTKEYTKAVRPRHGLKRQFNPWPQLGVTGVQYDKLMYSDAWHNPAAAFTPSDRRLANAAPIAASDEMAIAGLKRARDDWDDTASVGGRSMDSRHSHARSLQRSVAGARTIGGNISEMFAKSTRAGTASRQGDDRTTLYGDTERGENNSMFDATERAKTEGTQTDAATERATEKGSLYDASERRSHVGTGEDITERGSGCDVTERGSVADPMEGSAIL